MNTADAFDRIYDKIGQFGRHQIAIYVIANLGDISSAFTILLPVFIARTPDWTCPDNLTLNASTPINHTFVESKDNGTAYNFSYLSEKICESDNSICPGIEYTSDFTSIVSEWNLICGRKYITSLITTIQMAGVFFGAMIISQLADSFGRKPVWYFTLVVNAVVGFSSAFAPDWTVFAALRFITGMCTGGLFIVCYIYPIEFVGRRWRAFVGAIGMWPWAYMLLPLVAYYVRDWKTLTMVTAPVPAVVTIWMWCYLPESPRWLAMHNRLPEAEMVLKKIAEGNKKPLTDTSLQPLKQFAMNVTSTRKHSYWDLFRTKTSTKHALILMFDWFVFTVIYYALSLNVTNLPGDVYLNTFLMGLLEFPVSLITFYSNNRIGRRWTMFGPLLLAGVAFFCVLFVHVAGKSDELSVFVTVLALIGRLGDSAAWSVGYLYTAELFPTAIRNIGSGSASMAGRIGGVVAPQLGHLSNVSQELPFVVFGVMAISAAVITLFLPETKGRPLADTLPQWSWCKCCRREDKKENDQFDDPVEKVYLRTEEDGTKMTSM